MQLRSSRMILLQRRQRRCCSHPNTLVPHSLKGRHIVRIDAAFVRAHRHRRAAAHIVAIARLGRNGGALHQRAPPFGCSSRNGTASLRDGDVAGASSYDRGFRRLVGEPARSIASRRVASDHRGVCSCPSAMNRPETICLLSNRGFQVSADSCTVRSVATDQRSSRVLSRKARRSIKNQDRPATVAPKTRNQSIAIPANPRRPSDTMIGR